MTDYSKWKVTDLKAELKRRGIAQTGLRVKQQFIDKLVEEDAKEQNGDAGEEPATAQETPPEEESQVTEPPQGASAEQKDDGEPAHTVQEPQPTETESKTQDEKSADGELPEQSAQPSLADTSTEHPQEEPTAIATEEASQEHPTKEAPEVEKVEKQPETESTTEPVEQAPGDSAEEEPATIGAKEEVAPPEPAGKAAQTATLMSGNTTEFSTPAPNEEILEDRRKRKRRSQSPAPIPEDVLRKKAKAENEASIAAAPENQEAMDFDTTQQQEGPQDQVQSAAPETCAEKDGLQEDEAQAKKSAPPKHDVRFKGLFAPTEQEPARPASPPADTVMEDAEVEPAMHVATAALYIDGLMRPLQPGALRNHLAAIATAPGTSPNPDLIVDFYLDPIKTHCFVSFVNVSTASRARSSLHGAVWPNERNRKSLFVDFIPEHKVQEWIHTEEDSRQRSGPPPRWEVKYDKTDDGVEAVLEATDMKNAGTHTSRGPAPAEFSRPPPRGPKADMMNKDRRPSGPAPPANAPSRPGQGFKPLDELFKSTTAKPKLYYLPVPREVADRRLDRFDDLLQKGSYPRRGGDDARRITFEDEDVFVDVGPEYPARNRGGRGRGGRGRGGGMGDQWRDSRRG